eukprot:CAMPEP_0170614120 /NCGR_PEP_ID=MMETSP0224-20130122/24630_1 /TAXON_ID=285029 /ORGANISM="Togula jolla, Strain CCCM 725" /LENGTH=1283 /DNA_ID=CAMNT_0010939755 /DNA_START=66 /DNA_END=3917 /DNA_ORIENTATION=+
MAGLPVLHYYRIGELHSGPALPQQALELGVEVVQREICFNIEITAPLLPDEQKETFEPECCAQTSFLKVKEGESVLEVGPRQQFTSAWSSNAVSICSSMGLSKITRIEVSRRYHVRTGKAASAHAEAVQKLSTHLHDRMTECVYPDGIQSFDKHVEPKGWGTVPVIEEGAAALEKLSKEQGLGFDSQDVEYYLRIFKDELKRNPTEVECFDLAQGNSEHSRHWFFGGKLVIDGEAAPKTLFQLVKRPFEVNPSNSVIAFHDNSSALRGFKHNRLARTSGIVVPAAYVETERDYDLTLTVETHNFPCGIAPFPGAETGAGGRMRDGESTGQGSLIVGGIAGYAVGNLQIPGYDLPWEPKDAVYPPNMAPPLQVLIDSSNGASDYGNKFGEPLICGWTRTFGHRMESGERFEWIKPIMLSGGIGQMDHGHLKKQEPEKGQLVVKIGGPAYRIGVGGGAASSMVAGDNAAELDFNAVQRGDAEMLQKVDRVVRGCVELGDRNPILSIHDQGAGGSGNVLKEIAEPAGCEIDIRKMVVGDPSMSMLELWTAEFQENDALLLNAKDEELFASLCQRERAPYAVMGKVTGDGKIVVKDTRDGRVPVDLPLDKVLGKMPQKVFPMERVVVKPPSPLKLPPGLAVESLLSMGVLRLVSVCSKRFLTNKVDRSVTGLIAQQQCVGPLHTPLANFAAVAQSPLTVTGGATAIGEQPLKGLSGDPASCHAMGRLAVAEALTNLVWIKISSLDSIKASGNWMWPAKLKGEGPKMYDIAEALSDMMVELGIAIDGGKDSLSMAARVDSETVKSPGQMVITAYAPVPDVRVKVTPDLKTSGDGVLLFVDLGKGPDCLGGSALAQVLSMVGNGAVPDVNVAALKAAFLATQRLLEAGLLLAGHDRSDGGLLTCVLEMAFAGLSGVTLKLEAKEGVDPIAQLFGEAPGLVYEVRKADLPKVQSIFKEEGVVATEIGETRSDRQAVVTVGEDCVLDSSVVSLHAKWEATSFQLERLQCAVPCVEQEEAGFPARKVPPYNLSFVPEPTPTAALSSSRKQRVAIIRQEGSNGDREMAAAFHMAGFEAWDVHMTDLLDSRISLDKFSGATFVGGFSYADTMDSAKGWAASVLFNPSVCAQFKAFRDRPDTFSLGVCNGCQLMALLGWVPGGDGGEPLPDTGMEGTRLGVWVAHGEGRCHFPDEEVHNRVKKDGLIPMRYVDDEGEPTEVYPFNPNGSPGGVVGLCSADGRHLALMPHPERLTVWPWQWPYTPQEWTQGATELKASPWLKLFQNARAWQEARAA